jgi:hypothetical protein
MGAPVDREVKDVEEVKEVKDQNCFPLRLPPASSKNPGA